MTIMIVVAHLLLDVCAELEQVCGNRLVLFPQYVHQLACRPERVKGWSTIGSHEEARVEESQMQKCGSARQTRHLATPSSTRPRHPY